MNGRSLWLDFAANRSLLSTGAGMERVTQQAQRCGIDTLILGARDDNGFAAYRSEIVPHAHAADPTYPDGYDLVATGLEAARRHGLRILLAFPTFCEGRLGGSNAGMAFQHPDWVVHLIGLEDGMLGIRPATDPRPSFQSPTSIDAHSMVWVNPAHPAVLSHELSLIAELMDRYPVDGIVLDRARHLGGAADFSPTSHDLFTSFLGHSVSPWPEAVCTLRPGDPKPEVVPGPYYPQWMEWRVRTITAFIRRVRSIMDRTPDRVFANYTGSWYPLYDQMGVNWADPSVPPPFPHAGPGYQAAGFARIVDLSISGLYYPEVEEDEASALGRPYWYSVRGAARMAKTMTADARPIWGGLYLLQYRDEPERFQAAVRAALEATNGVMLFDLCYLQQYGWWDRLREVLVP